MPNNKNHIPPGYKPSPLGPIPNDWEVKELHGSVDILTGYAFQSDKFCNTGIKLLRGSNVKRNEVDWNPDITQYWESSSSALEKFKLAVGDIVIALDGALIGRSFAKIQEKDLPCFLVQRVARLRSKKVDQDFLHVLFMQNNFQVYTDSVKTHTAIPHISPGDIKKYNVVLPPLPEQTAIANLLSTWDKAIQTTNQLITQKEQRKKWLMQQLLTGKKRLKGFEKTKWKIQPLENFIRPVVREVDKPNIPYLGIGLRSHGKGTFLKYDELPEKNSMDKFYVVKPDDLIVNITFAWEQAIAIVKPDDDGALASHRFPTYTFIQDKGHPDFFRFYILQPRMKYMLQLISPGGAGRNRVMNKPDFINLEFLLPEFKEQTAIATVLQAADKELQLLQAKADALKEQKKGLMQVLLTGKKRLKIIT